MREEYAERGQDIQKEESRVTMCNLLSDMSKTITVLQHFWKSMERPHWL